MVTDQIHLSIPVHDLVNSYIYLEEVSYYRRLGEETNDPQVTAIPITCNIKGLSVLKHCRKKTTEVVKKEAIVFCGSNRIRFLKWGIKELI